MASQFTQKALLGFPKQYDDPETGCHTTDEAALQSCRQAYFLKQQNQLLQQQQTSGKLKDENTALQTQLETTKNELNLLKSDTRKDGLSGNLITIIVLIFVVAIVLTVFITKRLSRK